LLPRGDNARGALGVLSRGRLKAVKCRNNPAADHGLVGRAAPAYLRWRTGFGPQCCLAPGALNRSVRPQTALPNGTRCPCPLLRLPIAPSFTLREVTRNRSSRTSLRPTSPPSQRARSDPARS